MQGGEHALGGAGHADQAGAFQADQGKPAVEGEPLHRAARAATLPRRVARGGKAPGGSGRGKHTGHPAAHKGGKKGGEASASRSAAARSASAKKAAATRKRNAEHHASH